MAAGGVTTSPEAHQYNKLSDRLIKLCAELGLTPSARSRISVAEPDKTDDPMEAILLKFQGG
jgi:P27 family predicted phage terminase small subunit